MDTTFSLAFAAVVGFGHAFEADHLVAISNIVTKRRRLALAIKDGIFWGLGHSSTIFLIGLIIIVGKASIAQDTFAYFEGLVGVMLVFLGAFRLYRFFAKSKIMDDSEEVAKKQHHLAYGIGFIHGLAGSGAMILLVMTELHTSYSSMLYLIIFGIGSIIGMLVAASIFSIPFLQRMTNYKGIQSVLIFLSSILCIGYGVCIITENLV